ncbi:MAG: efflux RND transporter periplasmic adaptor subunit [Puniceicoccaceae bacterium]|nr:MAG: efflux RND transporter periplasmic adaptor subunit [Puniceicoccaceae bacterium]
MKFKPLLPYAFVAVLLLLIVGVLGGTKALQIVAMIEAGEAMPEPFETVGTHQAREDQWERTVRAIGSVTAIRGVTLAVETAGIVREIGFEPGTRVSAGAVLLRLDAELEEADLASARASAELARLNLDRARELYQTRSASRADLDTAEASLKQAEARVAALEAAIRRKTVTAPFDGRLGIRRVNLGAYLTPGTPVVSLQALEAVQVDFSLPQQNLDRIREGMTVRIRTDASPDRVFEGRLTALDPDVDPVSRSLSLQATLENPGELLRPGMFVQVEVVLPEPEPVVMIPATAVLRAPYGDSIFVVEKRADGAPVARQRFVRVGRTRGDFVSVTDGLRSGETVVTSGAFKLRNDLRLEINNDQVPEPRLDPRPEEA